MATYPSTRPPTSDRSAFAPSFGLPAPLGLILIALATCVVYWPSLWGDFIWDDDYHVTKPELRSVEGLSRIWFDLGATQQYYPLLHSAFWFEHRLWGDEVFGYHAVNLALHILASCLVYVVVRQLQIPGALLAAALFALHPVQVETVAWITEQKNTLSAVFYLSAMWAYLRFDQTRRPDLYVLAVVLFVLGLFSKTVTSTLPAALLVIFWWQRGRRSLAAGPDDPPQLSWTRDVVPLIPLFVLGITAGIVTIMVERQFLGAAGPMFELSFVQHILLAGRVIWFYLGKLVWPTNLIFMYPHWNLDPAALWQWWFPISAVALTVFLWAIRRQNRGPLAAWLFFVVTLFPALGFFNVAPLRFSFVADHFQYLASLGMFVLAAAGIESAIARLAAPLAWTARAMRVVVLIVLGVLSREQTAMYIGPVALYQTTIDRNPTCWMAYNNLGTEQLKRGQSQQALGNFDKAVQLKSDYWEAHFNHGSALARMGNPQEAIPHLERALQVFPNFPEARAKLGEALLNSGRLPEAREQLELALKLRPDYTEAQGNLGAVLYLLGQPEEGLKHLAEAVRLNPESAKAQFNLGSGLLNQGRALEAVQHLEQATRLNPEDAAVHVKLAEAFATLNRSAEAVAEARRALELARAQGQAALVRDIETWLKTNAAP